MVRAGEGQTHSYEVLRMNLLFLWKARDILVHIGGDSFLMSASFGPRCRTYERGQALIETALLLPFVLILLIVIVDFGIALDRREVILHSLREAGRSAAAGDSVSAIQGRALSESDGALSDPNQVAVCYRDEDSTNPLGGAGDAVVVHIDYDFSLSVGGGEMLSAAGINFPTIPISPTGEVRLIKDTSETSPTSC
jgi:TadE-like protein